MQVQDEQKRRKIIAAAGKLFAQRQFHKVCLDEVAGRAGVGKGTLYTYFASKDDLYLTVLEDALGELIELLGCQLADEGQTTAQSLRLIVGQLVDYAGNHPDLYELLRSGGLSLDRPSWNEKRRALVSLIEQVIRRGVQRGEVRDPRPELTAWFIPGLVRSAMLGRRNDEEPLSRRQLGEDICRFIETGIACKEGS